MRFSAKATELSAIVELREAFRTEMSCQIIHDSIHERPGWAQEYVLESAGSPAGYGSVAVGGPWRTSPTLFEFYVEPQHRNHVFALFETLAAACAFESIETQTNDTLLTVMLHSYCHVSETEAILFEDFRQTAYKPAGAKLRAATPQDAAALAALDLHGDAEWLLSFNGEPAGTGGILYHYNRPYGDIYMKIAEPFRCRGLGAYLVQELKSVCRARGSVPAARCNVHNQASRRTLQKAGFIPCGNLVAGRLRTRTAQT